MGLATILFLLFAALLAFPLVKESLGNLTKSPEQKAADAAKQKQRADEGFSSTILRIFAGDTIVDNSKKNAINAKTRRLDTAFKTNSKKLKIEQARAKGFGSVEELEKSTDTNRDVTKFNPTGIIGFGIKDVNDGKGLKDTKANRQLLLQKTPQKDSVVSRRKKTGRARR